MKSGSNLEKALTEGRFAVTAELGPPKSADVEAVKSKVAGLLGVADAVNITDNQTAVVRMSSIATAKLCLDLGLEPVMQTTCRDRNCLAIQADILGAYALGIRNVLCLTGDHMCFGNHPRAKGVFDLDSVQLIAMFKKMRDDKQFLCGEEIRNTKKAPIVEPKLFIGAAANPFGDPFAFRAVRLAKKIKAGADFIQTQCIFDMERFKKWMKAVCDMGLHEKVYILAGIMPVRSHKAMEYINKNVPGLTVPEALINRMKDAKDPKQESINISAEMIQQTREITGVKGVHIMAVEWEAIVPEIVDKTGLRNR